MRDTDLYQYLLGLQSPWTVGRVELNLQEQRVDVWAEHPEGVRWACKECGQELPLYDHSDERTWRHLDSCQFKTFLHARPPRVNCPDHGVRQARLPWAEQHARFTAMFERLAIDVLRETDISGATQILRISWDEAWHLMERAVARGRLAKKERICPLLGVDEDAVAKGHKYMTIVCDLERGTVEHIAEDRKQGSLDEYFRSLTPTQLAGIEAVAIDMWDPFARSILEHVPEPEDKIVYDRFHIMGHVGKAVDTVRKREHRMLTAIGDETLKGTKYLWLYAAENLPDRHRVRFDQLRAIQLKTGRAWAIKESLRELWNYRSYAWAKKHWLRWYFWATHSRLAPIIAVAQLIKRHLLNVLAYFDHPITNAVAEGLNSKIQTIKKAAYGFRNRDHFKTAVYFHCGGLDLYPVTHGNPG